MLALDVPVVAAVEPENDGIVVVVAHMGIAEDGMLGTAADGLLNGRSHGKVHVSHPKGDDVLGGFAAERRTNGRTFVPLHAAGILSLYILIEVKMHNSHLLLFTSYSAKPTPLNSKLLLLLHSRSAGAHSRRW